MNEILKKIYPDLVNYCKKYRLQESDCKDIVQNVLIKAYPKIDENATEEQILSYLKTNINWECCTFMKERENSIIDYRGYAPDFASIQNDKAISPELFDHILKFASELNYESLELFYMHRLTIKEISDKLSLPSGSVTSRLTRGRKEVLNALIAVRGLFNDK